eukprot:UN02545
MMFLWKYARACIGKPVAHQVNGHEHFFEHQIAEKRYLKLYWLEWIISLWEHQILLK